MAGGAAGDVAIPAWLYARVILSRHKHQEA
jgi:hypothetical protein